MNGNGSKPRSCFSKQFRDNYNKINWTCELCNGSGVLTHTDHIEKTGRNKAIHHMVTQICKCKAKEINLWK